LSIVLLSIEILGLIDTSNCRGLIITLWRIIGTNDAYLGFRGLTDAHDPCVDLPRF